MWTRQKPHLTGAIPGWVDVQPCPGGKRDPHLPMIIKLIANPSFKCTCIFGSSAAGQTIPIQFQLPTSVTATEREKLCFDFCRHIKNTCGQFGHDKIWEWPCGIGMNKKGGMNDEEFNKYVDNVIYPLFPNMEDTPGKRVLLKVGSGPGCNCLDLLVKAHFCGLYIFPGLPNITSVQQEQTTITVISRA